MAVLDDVRRISVTQAHAKGISGLVRDAAKGGDVVVTSHGRPVAAVVSTQHLKELRELEEDLRDVALVLLRMMTDNGVRYSLDEVMEMLGIDRAEIEAELDAELAAGQA